MHVLPPGLQQSLPPVCVAGDYNYQSGPDFKKTEKMLTGSHCAAVQIILSIYFSLWLLWYTESLSNYLSSEGGKSFEATGVNSTMWTDSCVQITGPLCVCVGSPGTRTSVWTFDRFRVHFWHSPFDWEILVLSSAKLITIQWFDKKDFEIRNETQEMEEIYWAGAAQMHSKTIAQPLFLHPDAASKDPLELWRSRWSFSKILIDHLWRSLIGANLNFPSTGALWTVVPTPPSV